MRTWIVMLSISALVIAFYLFLPNKEIAQVEMAENRKSSLQLTPMMAEGQTLDETGTAKFTIADSEKTELSGNSEPGSESENFIVTTTVSGRITGESGTGLKDLKVVLRSVSSRTSNRQMYHTLSNELGEFEFAEVSIGHIYRLEVKPTSQYSGHIVEAIEAVESLPRFDIRLSRLQRLNLEGLVTGFSGEPLADINLTVQNLSLDYALTAVKSDSSGYFVLPDFPVGHLKMFTAKPERLQITGIQLDSIKSSGVLLRFDRGPYHLHGWVSDKNSVLVDSATILLEAEFDYDGYLSSSKRESLTDSYGRFEFGNLSQIDHRLTVYAPGKRAFKLIHHFSDYSDQLHIQID